MEELRGKPELQKQKYLMLPYHILIKLLFQLSPEMCIVYEIGSVSIEEK